ncbi:uncharacterized protein DUF3987 [Roseivirga pacifica]|uniref:DUF3987 domain-containing protein n=1 Tax=Roseivirga pacifica TaxID=1267423 RepID=A0A1I0QHT4_9BACT|nr:DUF3987 domain-containing protein [Roseivirga pacifica]RKQ42912.1 uncharacterized protein DUF3987 [Roseivirga pacifica]SEW26496.1 Protein of unknown function [Roseivirga pacifica]
MTDNNVNPSNNQEVKELLKQEFNSSELLFPINAFPDRISKVIHHTKESLLFPVDYTGCSILVAASIALGNKYRIQVKEGYTQSASLYCAIVGDPGVNKSAPLKFIFDPLMNIHHELHNQFSREKKEYNRLNDEDKQKVAEPKVKGLLLSDSTFESVIKYLENNSHGLGIYNDELASWLKNFNRYNGGSDIEYWLSIWSNTPLNKSRAADDPILVGNPFVSVIGTIQVDIIRNAIEKMGENGFYDRFIYAYPKDLKKESWKSIKYSLSPEITSLWKETIYNLYSQQKTDFATSKTDSRSILISEEGMEFLTWYQDMLTSYLNQSTNKKAKGILAKLELITLRICLILEALECSINNKQLHQISITSVKRALHLSCYFKSSAFSISFPEGTSTKRLNGQAKRLYEGLNESFNIQEAVEVSKEIGLSERGVYRYLKNEDYYDKIKQGEYVKKA